MATRVTETIVKINTAQGAKNLRDLQRQIDITRAGFKDLDRDSEAYQQQLVELKKAQGDYNAEMRLSVKEMDVQKEEVVMALNAIADPVSLYEPLYHDGGEAVYVMDQVKDNKNTDENWLRDIAIDEAMRHLGEREKHILTLRFFQGKTQTEVADEIGISQAQVSRLEKSALSCMRKYV